MAGVLDAEERGVAQRRGETDARLTATARRVGRDADDDRDADRRGVDRPRTADDAEVLQQRRPVEPACPSLGLAEALPRAVSHDPAEERLGRLAGVGLDREALGVLGVEHPRERRLVDDERRRHRLAPRRDPERDEAAEAVAEDGGRPGAPARRAASRIASASSTWTPRPAAAPSAREDR